MVFSSVPFLFYFLPILLGLYFAVPARWRTARNAVLLAGSLVFYAWGEGLLVGVLLVLILANHVIAKWLLPKRAAWGLALGIAVNLLPLLYYKYTGFFLDMVGAGFWGGPALLLGISFFTFQAISLQIDVWRGDAPVPERWWETALYIASFPQLIAGPIVRYQTIAGAIRGRQETVALFVDGVRLFLLGLGQKVLIANTLALPADEIFAIAPAELSASVAWVGLACYSLQIFFDFAGYSNMAMGLGAMFGFAFPRNFDFPYRAASMQEFWRRWHMTLSRWFRDYVYVPLGGNRGSTLMTWRNLWIVFFLCGFWHGAAWTFILWGAWHGLFLALERLPQMARIIRLPVVGHVYLLLIVALGWVLFRSPDLAHAAGYYAALFGGATTVTYSDIGFFLTDGALGMLIIGAILASGIQMRLVTRITSGEGGAVRTAGLWAGWGGLFALASLSLVLIAGDSYNPFIYFRF